MKQICSGFLLIVLVAPSSLAQTQKNSIDQVQQSLAEAYKAKTMQTLDVITIGRSSVDLYGAQIGGRLEDMGSFEKYIGGSPTAL